MLEQLAQSHSIDSLQASDGTASSTAFARLYGEPLFSLPSDLYIPPQALEVFLETFEGPLDLLLYLIRKQNFNVLDVPMAVLTQQYLAYVHQAKAKNLELAGEYLLMAALLIDIKSRMLLPKKKTVEETDEEDPRAELVRRLLEYEQIKLGAEKLDALPRAGRDFFPAYVALELLPVLIPPQVSIDDLSQAWKRIIERARINAHHSVTREALSVREHMSLILRQLSQHTRLEFTQLFTPCLEKGDGPALIVVHFLALLELAREALVEFTQDQAYAPIFLHRKVTTATA